MSQAASIARNLGAQRQGSNWRAPCPLGCGYDLSLADGEDGRLLVHCFGSCEFDELLTALVPYGLLDDDTDELAPAPVSKGRDARDVARRIESAWQIYAGTGEGLLVATYLREARGISLAPPLVLREHRRCPHRLGICLPAMVAPIVDLDGQFTGTQAIFLKADGRAKADLPKKFQRETRGVAKGGVVRLAEHAPDRALLVAEGLESTLSAMELYGLPGWSALSADNLKDGLELPSAVRSVLLAADADTSGAGQRAALVACRRWSSEGRAVRIVMPPSRPGMNTDFNDFLRMKRA